MNPSICLLVLSTCCLYASVVSNRASPPKKVLRLALGASKDAYLPPLTNVDLLGKIKGNWDTMPKLPSVLIGTLSDLTPKPNIFSILPKQIYNPLFDWPACDTIWWGASWNIVKGSKVLLMKHIFQKIAVFAFRGTEAYSLKAMEENFVANVTKNPFSVHKNYLDSYKKIAPWFLKEYKKIPSDYTVILTGYDTGGAQAYVAAVEAALKIGRRPDAVITFASPTVGDLEFRTEYRSKVGCKRTLSVIAIQDIFTRFPVGAVRPCEDTLVDSGPRPVNKIAEFLKETFMKAFPDIVPKIINNLLPKGIREQINKIFPQEKQSETIRNSMGTVDKYYNTMLDFEYSHNLYQGYEHGIKELYKEKYINFGCKKNL